MLDSGSNHGDDGDTGGCDGADKNGVIHNDGYHDHGSASDHCGTGPAN